MNFEEVSFFR